MKFTTLLAFFVLIASMEGQNIFESSFEEFPINTGISTIPPFYNSSNDSYVTKDRARTGEKSLYVKCNNSSQTCFFDYQNSLGEATITFYLYVDKAQQVTISPTGTFPFMRILDDEYAYCHISEKTFGPRNFKFSEWQKITLKNSIENRVLSFFINDELVGINNTTYPSSNLVCINSYGGANLYIDDITVTYDDQPSKLNNIAISSFHFNLYDMENIKDSLYVDVINKGSNTIKGIDFQYAIDNEIFEIKNDTLTIDSGKIRRIYLDNDLQLDAGKHKINIQVKLQSSTETSMDDNTLSFDVTRFARGNMVPIFEYTASCNYSYSPYTYYYAEKSIEQYGDDINVVILHLDDVMAVPNYTYVQDKYSTLFINKIEQPFITGYKHNLINGLKSHSNFTIDNKVLYNKVNNTMTCETKLTLDTVFEDRLYYTVLIVEDSLVGWNNDFDQYNGYSFSQFPYFEPYFDKPARIPYKDIIYRNVLTYALHSVYGKKISPTPLEAGQSLKLNDALPFDKNGFSNQTYIYTVLMDSNRKVLNSKKTRLSDVFDEISVIQAVSKNPIDLYPNPCKNELYVNIDGASDIVVTDMIGHSYDCQIKNNQIDVSNLVNGKYELTMKVDGKLLKGGFIKIE